MGKAATTFRAVGVSLRVASMARVPIRIMRRVIWPLSLAVDLIVPHPGCSRVVARPQARGRLMDSLMSAGLVLLLHGCQQPGKWPVSQGRKAQVSMVQGELAGEGIGHRHTEKASALCRQNTI